MDCPRCGAVNSVVRRFCAECGALLTPGCPSCGFSNEPGAKFCGGCGAGVGVFPSRVGTKFGSPASYTPKHLVEKILTSKSALEGERKQVTVLFADLKGSMELLAGRDPEEARKLLDPVLDHMMEAVHRYEGTVNQVMGDGIMALCGAPLAHEDHAARACYAALRMQERIGRHTGAIRQAEGVSIEIRVGLNSGDVVVRSIGSDLRIDYTAVGQTTHLAARLEQLATGGASFLTVATLRLAEGFVAVRSLGLVNVKGLSAPVEVYALTGVGAARTRLDAAAARGLSRFVGRDPEVEQLRRALEGAQAGYGQIVAVVGEPGIGKSRLFYEFTRSCPTDRWLVLESACVSYGKATSYLPVADLLRNYFKISGQDDHRAIREKVTGKLLTLDRALEPALPPLLALLDVRADDTRWEGLEPRERRQHILDAVKRLLLRESRPAARRDVRGSALDRRRDSGGPRCPGREPAGRAHPVPGQLPPEYSHGWAARSFYRQLHLDPLLSESADDLLRALLGDGPAIEPLKRALTARTEGNPLFLGESVRALVGGC